MEPLYIPLVPQHPLEEVENVTCWEWSGTALSEGAEAAEWFTKYIGKTASLVRFDNRRLPLYLLSICKLFHSNVKPPLAKVRLLNAFRKCVL